MELLEKCKQLSNGQSKHHFLRQTRGRNLTGPLGGEKKDGSILSVKISFKNQLQFFIQGIKSLVLYFPRNQENMLHLYDGCILGFCRPPSIPRLHDNKFI